MKAATLAVGTEVVDGQITDRNSAWISAQLVAAGIEVIEHRAVADDRAAIANALEDLSAQVELLFVTGGLGPTSDDFTRELISEVFESPLEFDQESWDHIVRRFEARGAEAKPIQRQQCFFPKSAKILENPAGTANAFWLETSRCSVIALPGPPPEIAALWEKHLALKIEALIPLNDRETLHIWKTLGVGESVIAELVEEIIAGKDLRVGYRAHLPYVEVKLWVRAASGSKSEKVLADIDDALSQWLVLTGKGDLADKMLRAVQIGLKVRILDSATNGLLQTRLLERAKELKLGEDSIQGSLKIINDLFQSDSAPDSDTDSGADVGFLPLEDVAVSVLPDVSSKSWRLKIKKQGSVALELEVAPSSLYSFGTDRGRRYLTERVFHLFSVHEVF